MKANLPTPRQFIDLFDSYSVSDPLPFDWEWFWSTVIKTIGCGPKTRLWIVEGGALEDSIEATLYYEEGVKRGQIHLQAEPGYPVPGWDWSVGHVKKPQKSELLWQILPSDTGIAVANGKGVGDLYGMVRRFDRACARNREKWNRERWSLLRAERKRYWRRLRKTLDGMDAETVAVQSLGTPEEDWDVEVHAGRTFHIYRFVGDDDTPADPPLKKGGRITISYPMSEKPNPDSSCMSFSVKLDQKLVTILLRAGVIKYTEAMTLV